MSISGPFIRRPVGTALLMVGVLIAGLVGYRQLPVSALPQVDYPTIVVSTLLPGASAETMVSAVTTPLERQLGQIPSLAQLTSVSSAASSQITLQFNLDRDIDAAEQDVQAAINAASNLLPRTLPTPPTYSKSNPADVPVISFSVSSDTLSPAQVDDYADSIFAQKLSQVSGVGLVTLNGGQRPAVRVQVDPVALAGRNLSLEDVRTILVQANVNQPKGNLDGPRQNYTVDANDQLTEAKLYAPLVVAYRDGAPVRLSDVAKVVDGVENTDVAGWAQSKRAVIVNVQRQPGANLIETAERVKKLVPQLSASLPRGIDVHVLSDRTETVRASVDDVQFTLILTIGLVVAVIYLFLHSFRATIIPGVAVPLSLIATFGVMLFAGYSLNNLTLMALTISTGFVVDDAIVMIENIARFIEQGKKPLDAALEGAKQIGFTILSLTVSLVAVLIPLLFMGGIIGRLFREFAVTLSTAIVISALVSLTLTAMMCAYILKPHDPHAKPNLVARTAERVWDRAVKAYDRGLQWVLGHQALTLMATIATVGFTALLAFVVPKGLFPQQDTGLLLGVTEAPPDISFEAMSERQQAVADVIRRDPDVASVASFIGADGTNPTLNSGRLSITLKPHDERAGAPEIIDRLNNQLSQVAGVAVYLQAVQDLQIDTRASRTQYQYTLEDADAAELATWAPRLLEKLKALPDLTDAASDQQSGGLQLSLVIDRDTASRLGVTSQTIDDTLYDAFGQRQVSTIFTQLNLYRVILEVAPAYQQNPQALDQIYVKAASALTTTNATGSASASGTNSGAPGSASASVATGSALPLSAFAHYERREAALSIAHEGQFPAVTLSFNVAPGASLGKAVDGVNAAFASLDAPASLHGDFQGAAAAFGESLASEPLLILAALLTVYIVLGVLYESYIHPVTILSTLPSAGVGAFLALIVCRSEFSIIALIGVVLLIGIVKKNAIMMIDFALEAERDEHKSPRDAIHQACLLRFRPIMMTTAAALLGGLPLALGRGIGSELRRPLGITIVGGLLLSQVLTLFTTPVIYLYMDRAAAWVNRKRGVPQRAPESREKDKTPTPVPAETSRQAS
ncbi:MAG TPA: efflux RND transporter permease subunit [Polyangia bacterium]|nr:efflux RND transporter permease subunit [Polyangia bacterium]